jgi:hypothetical protein
MKRQVTVWRMQDGYEIHDKGVRIYRGSGFNDASKNFVKKYLSRFNLEAERASVSRYSWLRGDYDLEIDKEEKSPNYLDEIELDPDMEPYGFKV